MAGHPALGVVAFGAYVPLPRLTRSEVVAANSWLEPALASRATSERSFCDWDEDTVTMGVEVSAAALGGLDRARVRSVYLGTTTPPFDDRSNSGIVATALGLDERLHTLDSMGSRKAGTSALVAALHDRAAATDDGDGLALCIAAEKGTAPVATTQELASGHGAAALAIGRGPGVAQVIAWSSLSVDFVDRYRGHGHEFDYLWEERWVRDEGYLKIVPRLVSQVLDRAGVLAKDIDHLCVPAPSPRVAKALARAADLENAALADSLDAGCGFTGSAHPLLMAVERLEAAKPGEKILVVGFGQGGDAVLLEATDSLVDYRRRARHDWRGGGRPEPYAKYLAFSGLAKIDRGIRSETDKQTPLSALNRHLAMVESFVGGRCTACGTVQFPRSTICVSPECREWDTQAPESFADTGARVVACSVDHLTYTPSPPARYGLVEFDTGARMTIDFTDVPAEGVTVGQRMRMAFRVKEHDPARGFTRYFWKAAPVRDSEG